MVGVPEMLVWFIVAGFWLLGLAAVVYLFWLLRGLVRGLRKLQTEIEELRRDLERAGK